MYALAAKRHMHEFGTTSEQLAWVKVAASQHAQHNPHALLQKPVTVEDVVNSPMLSDPLHRARQLRGHRQRRRADRGQRRGRAPPRAHQRQDPGPRRGAQAHQQRPHRPDLSPARAGPARAPSRSAGVTPKDIKYASIYDSFTITVVETIEDLGFCEKGQGGKFVADGGLLSPGGKLPVNTDGGGLCNNHPGMGGMSKMTEAVRQMRGEAHPAGAGSQLQPGAGPRHGRLARHAHGAARP